MPLLLPLMEARNFRQHSVLRSDRAFVKLKSVTRYCPFFVDDLTFPHKKERFQTTARQSESSRVTVGCVFLRLCETSRSLLDGGHSLIQMRTVRDLERNKTSPATDSLSCLPSGKGGIQTTARQVESGTFDIECVHNSFQIRCASHAAACVFTITRNISPHYPCNTKECHQEDNRKVSVEPSQIHAQRLPSKRH